MGTGVAVSGVDQFYRRDGGAVVFEAVPGTHEKTVGAGRDSDRSAVLDEMTHSTPNHSGDGNAQWEKRALPATNMLG